MKHDEEWFMSYARQDGSHYRPRRNVEPATWLTFVVGFVVTLIVLTFLVSWL